MFKPSKCLLIVSAIFYIKWIDLVLDPSWNQPAHGHNSIKDQKYSEPSTKQKIKISANS